VVHHDDREGLEIALRKRGVDTTVGYMSNCANLDIFPEFVTNCPNAEAAMTNLLHIPVHPNLSASDRKHLVEATRGACLELGP
jgi:dTDP-4-amino-4,6-dideoxygalactose transaminase